MMKTIKSMALTAVISLTGCFNPHLTSGKIRCEQEPLCPEGMICHTDKRCYYPEDIPDADTKKIIEDGGLQNVRDGRIEYDLEKKFQDSGASPDRILSDGRTYDLNKTVSDFGVPDSSVPPDVMLAPDISTLPDVLSTPDLPGGCYMNDFNDASDLEYLVAQNGVWSRDAEGYLKQIEVGGGYRMAYLSNATYSDFDATVKVRVPSGFSGDAHTGMLFRYTRESETGYNYDIDRGYILEIEEGDGSSFELTLEDAYNARLFFTRVDGAFDTWHTLRVRAAGSNITGYFNGEEIFTLENSLYSSGQIGFGSHISVSYFDDLEICLE